MAAYGQDEFCTEAGDHHAPHSMNIDVAISNGRACVLVPPHIILYEKVIQVICGQEDGSRRPGWLFGALWGDWLCISLPNLAEAQCPAWQQTADPRLLAPFELTSVRGSILKA